MTRLFVLLLWFGAAVASLERAEQTVSERWALRDFIVPVVALLGAPMSVGASAVKALPPVLSGQP